MRQLQTLNNGSVFFNLSIALGLFGIILLLVPQAAHSRKIRKIHIVKSGESVAKIADFYSVSQRDLKEMNHLKKERPLRLGQKLKIPNVLRVSGKKYKVQKGDTLASVATKFKRTADQIASTNKLKKNTPLQIGRTLIIPDKGSITRGIKAKGHDIKPIIFLRVRTGDRAKLKLYTSKGKLNRRSVKKLSYLSRDKIGNKVKRLNFRLIKMIQAVAEKFPDKPIEIISGYRAHTKKGEESQHAFGRALDFRIPGVACKQIYRFCKKLPRSGCGYYPKDGFVHMDAREESMFWVN